MKAPLMAVVALVALGVAACGGGGGGGSAYTAPTAAPTTPANNIPASQPVAGSVTISGQARQAFTSTSNGHTLYTFGADTANTSNCTTASGCTGIWPPYTAPAGTSASSLSTGFGLITRSDGSLQYTYQGFPMYMYSGDSASGSANGQGITSFGGTWDAAQPAAAATPGPTSPPSSCIGYYC
jgi:predicted lipoprotein with Yx(FWY)xxD motif